ncbi:MAG: NgoPII family restriction endonuclease [Erysipelotrichaceae bacterium]
MNIINAIINLVNNPITELKEYYYSRNRANSMGDALEEYVKDLFTNTFNSNVEERLEKIQRVFSYTGNNNNPPDAMLRGGDAIEIKKIENNNSALALNSSYPKQTVHKDSPMISQACRISEDWEEKDLIYSVGVISGNNLKSLCFVYGSDYAAEDSTYRRIKTTIKNGVESIPNVEFSETKELGRVNKVDPLGITYLRVRGMWGIENPWSVFDYIYKREFNSEFEFMCIINEDKWNSFNNISELMMLEEINEKLRIKDVKIKNPDNPSQLKNAKLIVYTK